MDTYRAFLAIIISFVILVGYQYLFVGFGPEEGANAPEQVQSQVETPQSTIEERGVPEASPAPVPVSAQQQVKPERAAKEIIIDSDLYTAVVTEAGGAVKSFTLKNYKEENTKESPGKQLVKTGGKDGLPLRFSWGSAVGPDMLYESSVQDVRFEDASGKSELTMKATSVYGLEIERTYIFDRNDYLIDLLVTVKNKSAQSLQGTPSLYQVNAPFQAETGSMRFLFSGPAAYLNEGLEEYKEKEFEDGPKTVQGAFDWVAYEGRYFMCGIVPEAGKTYNYTMEGSKDLVSTKLSGGLDTIQPGGEKVYKYRLFYGPKKLSMLQEIGYNLDKSVNFGWFDVIAKPTLSLLNFFYGFFKNYGIAIILVTVLFKAVFWPITQKGLKSMKNMQKLQPKMAKIKEKYKDDPAALNKETMSLYKTYKVNPLGGCLPMVLQIPVFFALYKVLLQCIELRHAPFMLWINDLSAPDRLWLGFDIPYLGGFPVLTILMGASMFLQQKLTPTTADPTQARIMMMLPIVFTFMFLNFASGLVLYWFINNLLAILQQQLINRGSKKTA